MKKRGISNILVTVVLVLIVLTIIVLVWNLIMRLTEENAARAQGQAKLYDEKYNLGPMNQGAEGIDIQLQRGPTRQILVGVEEEKIIPSADIVLVSDLSGSMRTGYICKGPTGNTLILPPTSLLSYCISQPDYELRWRNCYFNTINQTGCAHLGGVQFDESTIKFRQLQSSTDLFISAILEGEAAENKQIALVGYDDTARPEWIHDLSNDFSSLKETVEDKWYPAGGTCICCGLNKAIELLDTSESNNKIIILMSDGEPSLGCNGKNAYISPNISAEEAHNNGITVYTVGFGVTNRGDKILKDVAFLGGGNYYSADLSALEETYTTIATNLINKYATLDNTDHLRILIKGKDSSGNEISAIYIENFPPKKPFESKTLTIEFDRMTPPNLDFHEINRIEVYPALKLESGEIITLPTPSSVWNSP